MGIFLKEEWNHGLPMFKVRVGAASDRETSDEREDTWWWQMRILK